MAVDAHLIDLNHIEDVSDVEPEPTLAVRGTGYRPGPLGSEGKRLIKELLNATEDEDAPVGTRVFDRLGLDYEHRQWNGYDLYWADADRDTIVSALEAWNTAHSL